MHPCARLLSKEDSSFVFLARARLSVGSDGRETNVDCVEELSEKGKYETGGPAVSSTLYASFLVRLWCESRLQGAPPAATWQGEVEHIQTSRRWTFDTLNELADLLQRQAEEAGRAERG
jgi:hypothetical protein